MNDDEAPVRAEAASAYLDGELDVAERASAAADPDTMALVDSFARVRDALSNVDPVPDDIRSAAISVALEQFDATQLAAAAMPARAPATVTSLHTRRLHAYRVLARVAVAAVIVGVGVAALKPSNGGQDLKSSATEVPAARVPQSGAPVLKTAADAATAGTAAPNVLATESAAMGPAVNNAEDLARYASSLARDTTAPAASSAPSGAYGAAVPAPATPPASCLTPSDMVLGPISVLGVPAFAVRDTSTGVVRAVAASDCRVLLTTP